MKRYKRSKTKLLNELCYWCGSFNCYCDFDYYIDYPSPQEEYDFEKWILDRELLELRKRKLSKI